MNQTQETQEMMRSCTRDGMNALEREMKRLFDVLLAGVGLIVLSPLFLVCALMVWREHDGSVIFRQERVGRFGRPFHICKFRTMVADAEHDGPQLCNGEDDARLTATGRWLRASHLDELPQLWNVLKGEMSLVGPRPERPFFVEQIMKEDPRYRCLFQVRPGITSYATIYNGYTDTMEKMLRRLEMDLHYLEHRSLWQDFKVLIFTVVYYARGQKMTR